MNKKNMNKKINKINTTPNKKTYIEFKELANKGNNLFFQSEDGNNSFFIDHDLFDEFEEESMNNYKFLGYEEKGESRFDFFLRFLKENPNKKIILTSDRKDTSGNSDLEFIGFNGNNVITNYGEEWNETGSFYIKNIEEK